jgi:Protein of unknown function (DUF1579)
MKTEPQKEHQWLNKLVGEWTYEGEATIEPGRPPEKFKGTESVRSVGGLWVFCEGRGEMPYGCEAITFMTLGYDPKKGRYVGTWVGSMMTYLWLYNGSLDAQERVLMLDTEGPNFGGEELAKFQDLIEIKSDDHRVLTSQTLGDDGTWHRFMTANYRRKT